MRIFVVVALILAAAMVTIDRHRAEPRYTQTITMGGQVMFCEGEESLAGGYPTSWHCAPAHHRLSSTKPIVTARK